MQLQRSLWVGSWVEIVGAKQQRFELWRARTTRWGNSSYPDFLKRKIAFISVSKGAFFLFDFLLIKWGNSIFSLGRNPYSNINRCRILLQAVLASLGY